MKNKNDLEFAASLHEQVPPNWYYQSIRVDPFQRFWHKRRFEEVSKLIEPVRGWVLDIGCADGMFSKVILDKSQAERIIGIDVLKSSVSWANKHWGGRSRKMKFLVGDAQNLNFKNSSFEAVFCLEVLEHVRNPLRVLKEIKRVLKDNGYAVFLVPTDNFLFRVIWFFWLHFYPRGWVWRETHIQTYKGNYLTRLCQKAGFKIEKDNKFILGMLQVIKVRK
jgi:2-polyprenyl-3-methyl-5-hydroxy-6-metoxy-1,4-benzoquinol methylase